MTKFKGNNIKMKLIKNKTFKKVLVIVFIATMISIPLFLAMEIRFFYSNTCPYCREIKPFVMDKVNQYPTYLWGIYEISDQDNYEKYLSYGFVSVPAFVINTDDNREIKFVGADKQKLSCELEERSTKDCLTYSALESCVNGSWFR